MIDTEAIAWAYHRLDAYGVPYSKSNAAMMDRLKLMLEAAPTPPAQEDAPHSWIACSVGVEKPIRELRVRCHAHMEMYRDLGWTTTPLYTRPDNGELRKAAEWVLEFYDAVHSVNEERVLANLRAALKGKS